MAKRETYVLGAGFSKWLDNKMPLMVDLLSSIKADSGLTHNLKSAGLAPIMGLDSGFEALISHLFNRYPWKTEAEALYEKSLYETCVARAVSLLQTAEDSVDLTKFSQAASDLFSYWDDKRSTIITFNYDTLVERGLSQQRKQKLYSLWKLPIINVNQRGDTIDGAILDSGEFNNSIINPGDYPTLLKLHGSHNWLHSGQFGNPADQVYYYHPEDHGAARDINSRGLKPLIIPPSIEKSDFFRHSIVNISWEQARKSIQSSKDIYIIGYSVPPSDTYVELLLARAFTGHPKVHVVNIDSSSQFVDRMQQYFSDKDVDLDLSLVGSDAIEKMVGTLKV